MTKRKKRISKFELIARTFFVFSIVITVLGVLSLNSIESALNLDKQHLQEDIMKLNEEKDGLNVEQQRLVTLDRLIEVAGEYGYTFDTSNLLLLGPNE